VIAFIFRAIFVAVIIPIFGGVVALFAPMAVGWSFVGGIAVPVEIRFAASVATVCLVAISCILGLELHAEILWRRRHNRW